MPLYMCNVPHDTQQIFRFSVSLLQFAASASDYADAAAAAYLLLPPAIRA